MSRPGQRVLTLTLVGACALMLLLAILFEFGLGTGYSWQTVDAEGTAAGGDNAIDRTAFKLPPQETFADIAERPLFNDDRKPSPYEKPGDIEQPVAPPPVPLNVNLTGVVLSHTAPELRMAILHDVLKNQSVTLMEGMPLPGDQGSWTLVQIKDRSVTFKSAAGESQDVELKVASTNLKGGPARPGTPPKPGAPAAFGPGPPSTAANALPPPPGNPQAPDLQRRIEERRQQMRDAAEKMKQKKQDSPGQPAQPQL